MAKGAKIAAFWALTAATLAMVPFQNVHAHLSPLSQISAFGQQGNPMAKAAPSASLRYTPDPERRKATYAKAVAEAKKTNPALAELYVALSTQIDLYSVVHGYLTPYGMRADDLGDVLALSWFSAYQIANGGKTDDPSKAELNAIRTQLGLVSADLAKLSDAEKQAMADVLMLDMAVQQGALDAAKDVSPELQAQLSKTFTDVNKQSFNVDFAQLALGPKGFVPKNPAAVAAKPRTIAPAPAKSAAAPSKPSRGPAPIDTSNIVGVWYDSQIIFMAGGPAGSLKRFEKVTVFFKDGTVCYNCLSELITDPSLTQYRRKRPNNMGAWRKVGAKYLFRYPDSKDDNEVEASMLLPPAPDGLKLSGLFTTSGGMTLGGSDNYTSTSWSEDLRFTPDGRFSWGRNSAVVSSSLGVTFAGSNRKPSNGGRYRISGYTIILDFDDGRSETKSFVAFPKDKGYIVIDESGYWIKD